MSTAGPVSFFIPAYNCAETISDSIKSIYEGNFSDGDEVLVVDDGSTDETSQKLESIQARFPQIRILRHDCNRGGAAARNTAVANARNSVLFCLDSDNLLVPGSVLRLREFLLEARADVAAFEEARFFIRDIATVDKRWVFNAGQITLADYLSGPVIPGASGNYMFTKDSWVRANGYPEFAGALDAWGFGLRQAATGQRVFVMPGSFYYHRHGYDSYWVRSFRKGSPSSVAFQILTPFLDQIVEEDVAYLTGAKGRGQWLENLDRRPIRLRGGAKGKTGVVIHQSWASRLGYAKFLVGRAVKSVIKGFSIEW